MRNTKKRGISPVIATVILVAIAIVISIAAAFWMTGLLSSFTSYEKIEIRYIYATRDAGNSYTITLTVYNTGPATATIQELRINDVTVPSSKLNVTLPSTLNSGSYVAIEITGYTVSDFRPGITIKVSVITSVASYDKTVTLP
jgi:flagellin-like protein